MSSDSKRIFAWAALAAASFVAGLTPRAHAQEQRWIRQFGTSSFDQALALAPDDAGGVMVAGYTYGSLGGPIDGNADVFLGRYDSAGDRLWIRQFGTGEWDQAAALAPDGAGGVFVAGSTNGSLSGPNAGNLDAFVARYDSAGNRLWIRQFGTSAADAATALAPDGAGGMMVAGRTVGSLGGPNAGFNDAFVARYDGAGNRLWIRQFGTSEGEVATALAPDGVGGVMVAGSTGGSRGGPSAGSGDAFLARYDGAGDRLWIRQFGTSKRDQATALALDGAGGVMVAGLTLGSFTGRRAWSADAFLARYDSAGNRLWIRQFGTRERGDQATALAPDGAGGVMVAGYTYGSLGGPTAGGIDAFLARYDSAGDRLWIRQFGTSEWDQATALADGAGGVMVAGYTNGNLGGPHAGNVDAFLARFAFPLGDLNCDGRSDGADIDPFFLALGAPAVYLARFPNCDPLNGDLNCDGQLNGADIDAFFNCLGGNCTDCDANGIPDYCEALDPLAIESQPRDTTACAGNIVTLRVDTNRALSYQWRKNGVAIPGAILNPLVLGSVQLADAGDYDVIVADACDSLLSDVARLTVNDTPVINQQPQSQTVCLGERLVLMVVATGDDLSYQWSKNGRYLAGAAQATYVINSVTLADAGQYRVEIANPCGMVVSHTATVTVADLIYTQPVSRTVCENDPVLFFVGALGQSPTYQWRKDGVAIGGATGNFFVIPAAQLSDAGVYDVAVTSPECTQISEPATLTVRQCP